MQVLGAYLKLMTDIGVLLGGSSSNRSAISERMREVIEFEQDIAKVFLCTFMSSTVHNISASDNIQA